MLKMRYF